MALVLPATLLVAAVVRHHAPGVGAVRIEPAQGAAR
jgi:hypothetical protein